MKLLEVRSLYLNTVLVLFNEVTAWWLYAEQSILRCSFWSVVIELTLDVLKKFRRKFCSPKLEEKS